MLTYTLHERPGVRHSALPTFAALFLTLATGCATDFELPAPQLGRESAIVATPGTERDVTVVGFFDPDRHSARVTDPAVATAMLETVTDEDGDDEVRVVVTVVAVGTTALELLDGEQVIDTLQVEAREFGAYRLHPSQGQLIPFPPVPEPFGVAENSAAVLVMQPYDVAGQPLPLGVYPSISRVETAVELAPVSAGAIIGFPELPAGDYEVRSIDDENTSWEETVTVVAREDILSLELEWIESGEEITISVVGLTADGRSIVDLDPTLQVGGQPTEPTLGTWLFASGRPADGTELTAEWNGLSVTRTFAGD